MIFASKPGGSPQHFRHMYDKKVNLLGLISLFSLPQASTPPQLNTACPQLMAGTMRLLITLKEQQVCHMQISRSPWGTLLITFLRPLYACLRGFSNCYS